MLGYLLFSILGYLSGSIMFSHLIARKFCNVDISSVSDDGNPGAANVFKYGELKYGVIALILDVFKGILPVYVAAKYLDIHSIYFTLVLISPVLGHAMPVFYHFRGGKAIAASFGCLLGLIPNNFIVFALAVILFIFTFILVIKPSSIRCIASYAVFSLFCLGYIDIKAIRYGCILISIIVIFRHILAYDHEKPEFKLILWDHLRHRS